MTGITTASCARANAASSAKPIAASAQREPGFDSATTVAASAAAVSGSPAFSVSRPAEVSIQLPLTTSTAGANACHGPT